MGAITKIVLSDRPIYYFYDKLLKYICQDLSPVDVLWHSMEGFWPSYQLPIQLALADSAQTIVIDQVAVVIRPQTIEIEERSNFTWRLNACTLFSRLLNRPFYESEQLRMFLKFLRVRGTVELEIISDSPVYAHDLMITMLERWNNKYTYIDWTHYPLVLPIRIIAEHAPVWYQELISSPKVEYIYIGTTGEHHYGFRLPLRPLIRLTGPPSYSIAEEQRYSSIYSFEYMTSLPTVLIWEDKRDTEFIDYSISYASLSYRELFVFSQVVGPTIDVVGSMRLISNRSLFTIIFNPEVLVWCVVDLRNRRMLDSTSAVVTVTQVSSTEYQITVTIDNSINLEENEIYFVWGRKIS